MELKKGDTVKVYSPAVDRNTPAETDTATVKTIFQSGNIKVWSDLGHGYTITPKFFEIGGTIEVVNV